MDNVEKAARLKAMLAQIAPGNTIQAVPRPVNETAGIEGGVEAVSEGPPPIETGLQKLAEGRVQEVTDNELFNLEAIVLPQNRPVVFVRGAAYDDVDQPWLSLNTADVKARIGALLPCIGRIEVPHSLLPFGGTGFVVGDGLMMTNRHVAGLFSQGLGLKIRYQAGDAGVNFKKQVDSPEDDRSDYLSVRGVEMVHPYWDMALLRVEGLKSDRKLKLSVQAPEDIFDRDIVAIGYPARDDRSDLALQDRIFGGKYNVKRLQPGKVRPRATVRSFENMVNAVTHDASTLGGNSGSAIVSVDTGEVIALHFAGIYLKANYAVPMYELARDSRLAGKLNFDGQLEPTNDWEPAWRSVEEPAPVAQAPTPAPAATAPPVAAKAEVPVAAVQSAPLAASVSGNVVTWTIPLHISISIGNPVSTQAAAAAPVVEVEGVVVNQDYSNRAGYDPDFLEAIKVPLPSLSEAMKVDTAEVQPGARAHGDAYELAYHHYSVYMNKRRRTAWFSAANIDGDLRQAIGKREGDRWYRDPRILKSEQLGQEAFEPGIDRGHLTRRDDTAWGSDVESATAANNDTFHFTNCSLQAAAFNRGKDRWQGLEQFLLEQHAKKEKRRMVVITGPLFGAHDPVYKNDHMNYTVRCPLQFWKVCVLIRQNGTPAATAFVLGQEEIKDLPGFEEAFNVAATQIRIADLEKATGLDFGDLKEHDHFAAGGAKGTIESPAGTMGGTQGGRVIRDPGDIEV